MILTSLNHNILPGNIHNTNRLHNRSVDECSFVCANKVNLLLNLEKIVHDSFNLRFSVIERHICTTSSLLGINMTQYTTMRYSILYMTYLLNLLLYYVLYRFRGIFHTFCTEGLASHLIIPYISCWLHLPSQNLDSINNSTIHHIYFLTLVHLMKDSGLNCPL